MRVDVRFNHEDAGARGSTPWVRCTPGNPPPLRRDVTVARESGEKFLLIPNELVRKLFRACSDAVESRELLPALKSLQALPTRCYVRRLLRRMCGDCV